MRPSRFACLRNRPVVVVASGPSLTAADVDYCRGRAAVVVVNDNYRLAPWADALYAADPEWWDHHRGVPEFAGLRVTQDAGAARRWRLQYIECRRAAGFSLDAGIVHAGDNSGFQALNLAVLYGGRPIVLLGFDMQMRGAQRHWFGDHPGELNKASPYGHFAHAFNEAAQRHPDVEILNATRDSALECWPRVELCAVI